MEKPLVKLYFNGHSGLDLRPPHFGSWLPATKHTSFSLPTPIYSVNRPIPHSPSHQSYFLRLNYPPGLPCPSWQQFSKRISFNRIAPKVVVTLIYWTSYASIIKQPLAILTLHDSSVSHLCTFRFDRGRSKRWLHVTVIHLTTVSIGCSANVPLLILVKEYYRVLLGEITVSLYS